MSSSGTALSLTPKQSRFVEAYLGPARGNATEAARIAGYKGNDATLSAVGAENLGKPLIAETVAERLATSLRTLGADDILAELSAIARDKGPMARTADRLRALELLGRYHKLFSDKHEVVGAARTEIFVHYADRPIEP